MKQSERIRHYLDFQQNPLKNEYLGKKSLIKKTSLDPLEKFIVAVSFIPVVLFFVIGYLFFKPVHIFSNDGWSNSVMLIFWGVINIIVCLYAFAHGVLEIIEGAGETDEYKKLRDEYSAKGLVEVDDPFKAKCSEYDDYMECTVCSATREPLNYREYKWCEVPGNCSKCARFLRAMGKDPQQWNEYFHNIEKW